MSRGNLRAVHRPVSGGLDTAAFASVVANLAVVASHTGEPLTKAMVLGVGGGLGAGYIMREFDSHQFRARARVVPRHRVPCIGPEWRLRSSLPR